MDWNSITNLKDVGWATVIAMLIAMTVMIIGSIKEGKKKRELKLQEAEEEYRQAVASRDPDRIRIAAQRLLNARK